MTANTNAATKFDAMGKEELRAAMREAGLSYSKLNNDGMRAALVAHYAAGREIAVHDLSDMNPGAAYGATQCDDDIKDGDVLKLANGAVAVLMGAWPTLVVGECEGFHTMADGFTFDHIDDGKYARSAAKAREVAEEEEVAAPAKPSMTFAQILGVAPLPVQPASNGNVTRVVDGKKVEAQAARSKGEPRSDKPAAPAVPRVSRKGYTIQKEREERNGVKRPSEGTVCGQVWAEFDSNPEIKAGELAALSDAKGWNRTNVSCEFYAWRKFMGIKGRAAK